MSENNNKLTHNLLCLVAERFLEKNSFGVVFHDKFKAIISTGEQPDALGFRSGVSVLIECKTSRPDFLADKKKKFRVDPAMGMGDWRFFLTPKGLISVSELPEGWGLLECSLPSSLKPTELDEGRLVTKVRVNKVHGWPMNTEWVGSKPFPGNKQVEADYMYSALRRMVIRGHFKEIYDGHPASKSEI